MPIKGLSDRRRFSRGGKIRLGEKKVSQKGKEYPAKIDYFLFDPDDESLRPVFEKLYGEKPRKLRIAFASDDPEEVFPQHYKLYGASGLACKGDGERAHRISQKGDLVELECPGPDLCEFSMSKGIGGRPGCKQVASLQFFLPDLPVMQVFQIDTSSFHSIVQINSALDLLRRVAGRLSFVPIDLVLNPKEVQPEGRKSIIYALDIVLPVGLANVTQLQPLLAYAGTSAPSPHEALPDDLYARSQTRALPGPADPETTPEPEPEESADAATDHMPEAEAEEVVDPDTGEVLPDSVWDDPEVQELLGGLSEIKRKAFIASADGWSVADITGALKNMQSKPQPKPKQAPSGDLF